MKNKLFFLSVILLFTLSSCNEVITCTITSPVPDAEGKLEFYKHQEIPVTVEASTTKGSIIQVEILVDEDVIQSLTKPPYNFTIPENTIEPGLHHILTAVAFSSRGNREVSAMYFTIKE
ncbi:MAG: Ig-like domain-containing protein [Bacteroidetes bacterium]|nr:Ig-like domain-containing protein [Bacteroidota bacterium]MCL1968322.1 Ig-like domain-containing protein [Bacteroidota bacterium]